MRVCIFTEDLGTIAARKEGLLQQLAAFTGQRVSADPVFVGLRQTGPVPPGTVAVQPYVVPESYTRVRVANAMLRLAQARLVPLWTARIALSLCAAAVVEAIVACDSDVVLLDVRWGRYLKALLEDEYGGAVYVSGEGSRTAPGQPASTATDSSAKVSIVLPTHNGSTYFRQSIESCLSQSYANLELIVVDDGSAQDVRGIVAEYTDPRIQYLRHDRNQGLPAALNTGFRAASGMFLSWTSDDNYYAPDAIERLVRFLQRNPRTDFVYSSMFIVDASQQGSPKVRSALPPADLKHQNSIGACFMYTRRVYAAIGEYDAAAILVEDYDYWIRVSKRFRMQRILEPLYYYRYHAQSLTSKHTREEVARRFDLVRNQNGLSAAP
jgi:GT2 family glycosyltransferase